MSEDTIKLTDEQRKRIDEIKQQSTEDGKVPPLPDSQILDSLLDTWDAVDCGYYTDDHTPNDELRELIEEWRQTATELEDPLQTDYGLGQKIVYERLAGELEQLIDDE